MDAADQLGLFKARIDELRQTRLVRSGSLHANLTITWDKMLGLRFQNLEPDEDDLRSFLLTFRHFVINDEPVFLYKIYNICQQRLSSDELKGRLIKSREHWKQSLKCGGIKLRIGGTELPPERIADLWINGWYFHSDEKKRKELIGLFPLPGMLVRHNFLDFLVEATRQVLYVGSVVIVARRDGMLAV